MAKDNKIIIEIVTNDKGTTAAIRNNKKLDDSMKKTRKSTDEAANAGRGYHATHKSIYQTNLSSAKGFSKQAESIGSGGSSGLVGAYATLAANVFAATAAFNALRGAAQVQTLIEGFTFLGNAAGQSSLQIANGLKEITNNAISLEQSLRASSIALTSGFDTTQIAGLAEVARNASIALGRNMGDSIDRLFRGVAKLEPEILDELGIMVRLDTAVSKYAATLGKSATELTDYERRQAFLNETLTQGAMKYGDLSNAVDPNAYDKLAGSLQDLANTGLELINKFLNPFIKMLASSSGALMGGLILFGSTILTTMIPALGQMAERQAAVAHTAREMAAEQAKAGKVAAQQAKIKFIRTEGSAAFTTKGTEFKAVEALKKNLKRGKVDATDFNKALKQIQNTQNRTAAIAKQNKTLNSAAHQQRMAELDALKAQILSVQQAEAGRSGSAGASALAGAEARGQQGVSESMVLIGGSGAIGGFKEARKGLSAYRKELRDAKDAFVGPKSPFSPGRLAKWGMSISAAFTTGSVAVKLFGSALLNAIPIIGQLLFFGGLLFAMFSKLKGETRESEKALKNLQNTVETSSEKFEQLAETNKNLTATFDSLEEEIRGVAIEAQATKNEIVVTAGVVEEARVNFETFTKALANEKDLTKGQVLLRGLGSALSSLGSIVLKVVLAPFKALLSTLGILFGALAKIPGISHAIKAVNTMLTESEADKRQRLFNEAIEASRTEIEALRKSNEGLADHMNDFDPAAEFERLQNTINPLTGDFYTFQDAQKEVNRLFRENTKGSKETSENLKGLGTALQEIGKVVNKNIDGILKRNPFDKIASTVQTLNNSLTQMAKSEMLTDQQILNQLTLASSQVGVSMSDLGITLETVRNNLENDLPAYGNLQQAMEQLADKTRNNSARQKELAVNVQIVNQAFKNMKAIDEYAAKLANFKKTGKFEIGAVDNYNLELKAAERARQQAEAQYNLKIKQIDLEYDLELFKLKVFETQMRAKLPEGEYEAIKKTLTDIITKRKSLAQMDLDNKILTADAKEVATVAEAGKTGTLGERSQIVASALNAEENTTAGRLQNVANAMQPMQDALKELGPEGEAVSAAFDGIMSIAQAFQKAGAEGATTADKLEAVGSVVTAISAAMAANSRAQIKEIDNQIDKEKKRDGKSKESLAKIAAMEKKKDQMARKAFEQNKKMKIAQAVISTSAAIAGQLGSPPVGPWNVALAAMMGALGMAQVKIIQKQQYQGSDSSGGSATPQTIQVGKRTNRVDTSRAVTDGELAFLRGAKGQGSNANNFTPGGAAGMKRGYANGGEIMVGERGPETITPMAGGYEVTPNDKIGQQSLNANITINAIDAAGVEEVLTAQRGNIIGMIREAAHEHGEEFIESVNTSSYGAAEGDGGY